MKKIHDPALFLIGLTFVAAVLALLVLFFSGCDDGCEPEELRCHGQHSEVCNAAGDWELIGDCSSIEGGGAWVCCLGHNLYTDADEYGCYLEDDCVGRE